MQYISKQEKEVMNMGIKFTVCLLLVLSSIFSESQELRTDITDINYSNISYSNSKANLFVGLDYSEALETNSWHDAEATGMIVHEAGTHGSFEIPILLLSQQYPKLFFRTKVSESIIGSWIPYTEIVPQFVSHDYIELEKIEYISRFRSGAGHDYSDDYEECRSMKHYFHPHSSVSNWTSINIYSPVSGTIIDLSDSNGTRVTIQSSQNPACQFIIFHVGILPKIMKGYKVSAGEHIGTHAGNSTISDIAVRIFTLHNGSPRKRLISYFDVMTDSLFSAYQTRGLQNREDVIISAEDRDNDPLNCNGEEFYLDEGETMHPDGGYGSLNNKFYLSEP